MKLCDKSPRIYRELVAALLLHLGGEAWKLTKVTSSPFPIILTM